jgi:predicted NBD/HSP70 family sugar kinase
MPEFKSEVAHGLGREQAVDRLKKFVQQVRDQFEDQVETADGTWADNVLDFSVKAVGISISGKLTVEDTRAHVAGTLPIMAIPFRGMIEQRIAEQLETALT